MATTGDGLIFAMMLDGRGGAAELDWPGVESHWHDDALVWVHLDCTQDRVKAWLKDSSGLDADTADALVVQESRPRSHVVGDGLQINLRGVNLNPGADPEDMVSLRMWVEHNRVITLRRDKLLAVEDVHEQLTQGKGPNDAPGMLIALAQRLVGRVGAVVNELDDETDALEEEVLTHETYALRSRISNTRRKAIKIRRFLSPQRDALSALRGVELSWLDASDRARLRDVADLVTRYVEDLDLIRDRAVVIQEELGSRLAEHSNRTLYMLSMVATIFLPLGLLTGLLGINVGGMPGVDSPWAFAAVCVALVVLSIIEIIILRALKWL
ncbi:MAG: zinc transporter ZntB [Phycisphaerales bacterium JB063]